MDNWTHEEQLAFDIAFALKKVTIPGFRKALKEEDRFAIAGTIAEHLKLCRWEFSKPSESICSDGRILARASNKSLKRKQRLSRIKHCFGTNARR